MINTQKELRITKTGMNPRAILISEIQQSNISFSNPCHPLILNFDNQCVKHEHFNPTTIQANKPEADRFVTPIHTQKPKYHTSSAQLIIVVSTSIYPIITTSKTPNREQNPNQNIKNHKNRSKPKPKNSPDPKGIEDDRR